MNSVKAKLSITKEELEDLYIRQRKTQQEIGDMFGVTGGAILYWRKIYGIDTVKKQRQLMLDATPSLSYVLGVLRGDGFIYVNERRKRHYVYLSVVDSIFAQQFLHALTNIGLSAKWVHVKTQNNDKPQIKVYAENKEFVSWHKNLTRRAESTIINQFPLDFLRGMYDSEGTIGWGNSDNLFHLRIVTTNKVTKKYVHKIMTDLNLNVRERTRKLESDKTLFELSLWRANDVQRFLCMVQPSIKVLPRSENNMLIPSQARQGIALKV